MTMNLNRLDWLVTLFVLLCCSAIVILMMTTGCILNPGAQVREGLMQTKEYRFKDQELVVIGTGTHEEKFTAAAGYIVLNEDGTINLVESRLSHYLKSEPSADEAMAGLATAFVALAEQQRIAAEAWAETLAFMRSVVPAFAPPPPAGEGESDGG